MSVTDDFSFTVEPAVKKWGLKVRGVVISGVANSTYPTELKELLKKRSAAVLAGLDPENYKQDEILQGFWHLHEQLQIRRRDNRSSSESLLRLLLNKGHLFQIDPIVDIYNLISIETKLALGAHDIDKIGGAKVQLKITDGTENYAPLGSHKAKKVKAGEYCYVDGDNDVICRLEVKQVNKTKITADSKDIFYIVEGNEATSDDYLNRVSNELVEITTKYLGGKGKILDSED